MQGCRTRPATRRLLRIRRHSAADRRRERIFIELTTSGRKLKASKEGRKLKASRETLVSLSLRRKDLLGPVTKVKKKGFRFHGVGFASERVWAKEQGRIPSHTKVLGSGFTLKRLTIELKQKPGWSTSERVLVKEHGQFLFVY